jgi:hypothetical protein
LSGLIWFSLAFGQMLLPDEGTVQQLGLYLFMSALALCLINHNRVRLTKILAFFRYTHQTAMNVDHSTTPVAADLRRVPQPLPAHVPTLRPASVPPRSPSAQAASTPRPPANNSTSASSAAANRASPKSTP